MRWAQVEEHGDNQLFFLEWADSALNRAESYLSRSNLGRSPLGDPAACTVSRQRMLNLIDKIDEEVNLVQLRPARKLRRLQRVAQ